MSLKELLSQEIDHEGKQRLISLGIGRHYNGDFIFTEDFRWFWWTINPELRQKILVVSRNVWEQLNEDHLHIVGFWAKKKGLSLSIETTKKVAKYPPRICPWKPSEFIWRPRGEKN